MKKLLLTCILFNLSLSIWAQISIKKLNGGFIILDQHKEVAFYQRNRQKLTPYTEQNNFLYPVFLPNEISITDDILQTPDGKPGIFWGWPHVYIQGKDICNSWTGEGLINKIKSIEFQQLPDGSGKLSIVGYWSSPNFRGGEFEFLREENTITFYPIKDNYRRIDFSIDFYPRISKIKLAKDPDNKYGGFAIRIKPLKNIQFYGDKKRLSLSGKEFLGERFVQINTKLKSCGSNGGLILYNGNRTKERKTPYQWILDRTGGIQSMAYPSSASDMTVELTQTTPLKLNYSLVLYKGKIDIHRIIHSLNEQK